MKMFVFLSVLSLFSAAISNEATKEEMVVHELLVNRDLILAFVSHPKTQEFFITQQQKQDDFYRSHDAEMQFFLKEYPDSKEAEWVDWSHIMQIVNFNIQHKEIVIPFILWGVANLYGIEDLKLVGDLQELQVRLFADFLCREGILLGDETLEEDLIDFCKNSPLPVFSQIIGPLVSWEVEKVDSEGDIVIARPCREIIDFYSGEDILGENVSDDQSQQLECIFNPLGTHCKRWKWRQAHSAKRLVLPKTVSQGLQYLEEEDEFWVGDNKNLGETPDSVNLAGAAMDQIFKDAEDFFPKEVILSLFFEVIGECYPQLHDALFWLKQSITKGSD
ncbi:MAG: hypothetical protein V4489_02960 [Chlamydiota bacterium]